MLAHSPQISLNGLVLCLDAANQKSYGDNTENLLTYSSMSGWIVGVLGSGGSLPTGWVLDQQQPGSTITIIGGGIENGLNYVDIRFSATSVTTSNRTLIRPGNSVTTDGSTYYLTSYSKLISGNSTNLTFINFHTGALSLTSTLTRNVGSSQVLSGTFFPRYDVGCNVTDVGYDITIRFAAPQLEKGSSVGPYYPTTGTIKNRGTTWTDLSGLGNNGTLVNGVGYNGSNGGSLSFDGVNDYVDCGDREIFKIPSQLTLEAFFNISTYVNWSGIIGKSNTLKGVYVMHLSSSAQRIRFSYNSVNPWTANIIDGNYPLTANQWVHSVITYDGSNVNFYINGSLDKTQNIGSITFDTGAGYSVTLGQDPPGANEVFNGRISNAKIYNRALSAAEIKQNFNALKSRYGLT